LRANESIAFEEKALFMDSQFKRNFVFNWREQSTKLHEGFAGIIQNQ
jgi:hypothetical protein